MDTNGSTGSPSRLNRPQSAFLGTSQYAYEELVAEMCSCFMGAELQMELYRRLQQQDKGS
jgi:antirestriction protein ArdC